MRRAGLLLVLVAIADVLTNVLGAVVPERFVSGWWPALLAVLALALVTQAFVAEGSKKASARPRKQYA